MEKGWSLRGEDGLWTNEDQGKGRTLVVVCLKELECGPFVCGGCCVSCVFVVDEKKKKKCCQFCVSFLFALCVDDFGDDGKKCPLALTRLEASHPQAHGRALR